MITPWVLLGLLDRTVVAPPLVVEAGHVYESQAGLFEFFAASPTGGLYYRNANRVWFAQDGVARALKTPAQTDACYGIGLYDGGVALNVNLDDKGNAVYAMSDGGFRPLSVPTVHLSARSAAGRTVVGTKYETERGKAYRWTGQWIPLEDFGAGSEAMKVLQDGTVLGCVGRKGQTLPCVWRGAGAPTTLPLPAGLDNGVAVCSFDGVVLGFAGRLADRSGDIENYSRAVVWRGGKLDESYVTISHPKKGDFLAINLVAGGSLLGTFTPSSEPSLRKGVIVGKDRVTPLVAVYKGRRYAIDEIVGGYGRTAIGTGHLIRQKAPYVDALITFPVPRGR